MNVAVRSSFNSRWLRYPNEECKLSQYGSNIWYLHEHSDELVLIWRFADPIEYVENASTRTGTLVWYSRDHVYVESKCLKLAGMLV